MLGHPLRAINATVLPPGTAETYHKGGEPSFNVSLDRRIDKRLDMLKKRQHLAILFKKLNDRRIHPGQCLVTVIAPGVMNRTTVKDISAAIAAAISRDSFFIGKARDGNGQFCLLVLLYLSL